MLSQLLKNQKDSDTARYYQPVPVRPSQKVSPSFFHDGSNDSEVTAESVDEVFYVGSPTNDPSTNSFSRSQANPLVDPKIFFDPLTAASFSPRNAPFYAGQSNDERSLSDETSTSDCTDGYSTDEELKSFDPDGDLPFDLTFKHPGVYTPHDLEQMQIKEESRSKTSSTLSGRTDSSMSTCSSNHSPRPAHEFAPVSKKSSQSLFSDLSIDDHSNGVRSKLTNVPSV